MKILIICKIVFLSLFLANCSSKKENTTNYKLDKYPVLDSLKYVKLPDEYFLPKGNDIFRKIISKKDSITPYLIEKIKDTTKTEIRIADSYNYKTSDVAFFIIPYTTNKKISLRDLVFEEFKKELKNKELQYSLFEQCYYELFFSNTNEINYNNRIRLYQRLKKWNQ